MNRRCHSINGGSLEFKHKSPFKGFKKLILRILKDEWDGREIVPISSLVVSPDFEQYRRNQVFSPG